MSKNPSPRGRHRQLGTVNEDPEFQILHRRQDRWHVASIIKLVHEALLAATLLVRRSGLLRPALSMLARELVVHELVNRESC